MIAAENGAKKYMWQSQVETNIILFLIGLIKLITMLVYFNVLGPNLVLT